MPRRKKQERKIGKHTKTNMEMALKAVEVGSSIRQAAKDHNIAYPTFRRYANKWKEVGENMSLVPRYDINRVFSEEQEKSLLEYYKECALLFYGLTVKDCRYVAYEMAKKNNLKIPPAWERDGLAGLEWFRSFKQRHPEITVKKPEPVSLARATAFNPESVKVFFDNLQTVIERHPQFSDGTRIFNLDETSTTTVQKPQKVVAPRGVSVSKVTSGEKGTLVTTCCMVSATGFALPPAIIFPRKKFKNIMLNGAPSGSLGLANPSGWMTSLLFVEVIKHFVKQTRTTPEDPSLLLMDNHESHLSIEALDYAKNAGVTVLTFHPHTTNKLQPLDVGLMGPFKTYYYSALESWMLHNPGRPVTIYEIARFIGQAHPRAMTITNISSAFSKCGIFPFDRNIFTEIDFLPSNVTDRPVPANNEPNVEIEAQREQDSTAISSPTSLRNISIIQNISTPEPPLGSISRDNSPSLLSFTPFTFEVDSINKENEKPRKNAPGHFISPKEFRPPIKAGPRSNKRRRKPGRSIIATDTPEKDLIAANRAATKMRKEASKKSGNFKRKVLNEIKIDQTSTSGVKCVKIAKRPKKDETDSDESAEEIILESDTDVDTDLNLSDDDDDRVIDENFSPLCQKLKLDDFVLILLESKKQAVYYVAKIVAEEADNEYLVSFLKLKREEQPCFIFPLEPDLAVVNLSDIKFILPPPKNTGTKRLTKYFFKVNLSLLNVK